MGEGKKQREGIEGAEGNEGEEKRKRFNHGWLG
jgi:hypothetical protein